MTAPTPDEYTPTTPEIMHAWRDSQDFLAQVQRIERPTDEESDEAFSRWLAQHDAEVGEKVAQAIERIFLHSTVPGEREIIRGLLAEAAATAREVTS